MLRVAPGAEFEIYSVGLATGLEGTIGVRIRDGQGADALARTTDDIVEDIDGLGIYRTVLTAPEVPGDYWIVFDDDAGGSTLEQLVVTRAPLPTAEPSGRDLCALEDVLAYMPELELDDNERLQILISAESDDFHEMTQREIRPESTEPETRVFDVDDWVAGEGVLRIGDATEISSVQVKDQNDTVVDSDPAYEEHPRNRRSWQPIRRLRFRRSFASSLAAGYTIEVEAIWGWPQVPNRVRRAVVIFVARSYVRNLTAYSDSAEEILPDARVTLARDVKWALDVRQSLTVPKLG
jgi:hypothetical protein